MGVERFIAALVTHPDMATVAFAEAHEFHYAITGHLYWRAGRGLKVDTGVQVQLPRQRVVALAKA